MSIGARYFTDPDGYDDRIMLTGVKLARTIAEQSPLSPWVARERAPIRLACIRHAASVYPEPGSNSPHLSLSKLGA